MCDNAVCGFLAMASMVMVVICSLEYFIFYVGIYKDVHIVVGIWICLCVVGIGIGCVFCGIVNGDQVFLGVIFECVIVCVLEKSFDH